MKIEILIGFLFLFLLPRAASQIVAVQFGNNIPPGVQTSILKLLNNTAQYPIHQFSASDDPFSALTSGSFLLSFGLTATSQQVLDYNKLQDAGPEAMMVYNDVVQEVIRVVGDGNPLSSTANSSIGAGFASYRALELLGFAFLHPFEPATPPQLLQPNTSTSTLQLEAPHWPVRGSHYHTEHPLELVEVLQGMGVNASMDPNDPSWASMLPEVELFAQWLVATRQNRVEWLLLCGKDWYFFCASDLRAQRLKTVIDIFHSYGTIVGADLPIIEKQQQAWYMIEESGDLQKEYAQIAQRIDWLLAIGYDFISTESGFSEFTHPDDTKMLNWMEYTADYAQQKGSKAFIKCHCSTGQTCKHYKDPRNGEPLNFNFLPMLANSSLGIYAHTVQMYTFDDPAPTYGNQNFSYMFDFMMYEAPTRDTIYHGETAYWCNYDIDVPLLLPIYGSARLNDLRKTAFQEKDNSKILGQMNFCSGFEWGYWINEAITHRAAWNPHIELSSDDDALQAVLTEVLPVFGNATGQVVELIQEVISAEHQLLVLGQVTGQPAPANPAKLNGIAYLEGWDSGSDVGAATGFIVTQPGKLGLLEARLPYQHPSYHEIAPLLQEMADRFTNLTLKFENLRSSVPEYTLSLFNELIDAMNITALRAIQVNALYEYVSTWNPFSGYRHPELFETSFDILTQAADVVARREQHYRVPVERIAGWRNNPTAYTYGYLWTVHSLYYFWRDHDRATLAHPEIFSPCYMNINIPVRIDFGEGIADNVTHALYNLLQKHPQWNFLSDCLSAPGDEPHYPQ